MSNEQKKDSKGKKISVLEKAAWYALGTVTTVAVAGVALWGVNRAVQKSTGVKVDGNNVYVTDGDKTIHAKKIPAQYELVD